MDNICAPCLTAEEIAAVADTIQAQLAELEHTREAMRKAQVLIDSSGVRTDLVLSEIRTELSRLRANSRVVPV